jgi:hypothetical protein
MREIRTSGSMSGVGKRGDVRVATAPGPDSTERKGGRWWVVGGRWGGAGSKIQGLRQESEVRMKSICFPPSAFCLLPTAYCVSGLYNVPQRGCGVYTLGYDAIPELISRRNQLNQEGSP